MKPTDARHGLHTRRRKNRLVDAQNSSDPDVFGDDAPVIRRLADQF